MLHSQQDSGMRQLDLQEIDLVSGGGLGRPLRLSWKIGTEIGGAIYDNLSIETQDAIGGTISGAIDNIKSGRPFG